MKIKESPLCKRRLERGYDIVKAHGGEIKVESKDGEGSEFIIQLMINS